MTATANLEPSSDLILTDYGSREKWLAARGNSIGASESAALFGVSPWETPVSLWAKKTDRVQEPEIDGEWLTWGLLLEEPIAKRYEQVTGRTTWRGGSPYCIARHPRFEFMTSTPDFYVTFAPDRTGNGMLQCKNTMAPRAHDWDEGVPDHIVIQVQHEMAVTGREWVSVAVLIGGNEFKYFDVERNQNVIDEIEEQCRIFWGYVERDEQPPVDGSERTQEVIKRLHPADNGNTIELDENAMDWWAALEAAKAAEKVAKDAKTEADTHLRDAIGANTFAKLPDGRLLSLKTTPNPGYTSVVKPYTYRTLREVKAAKGRKR